MQHVAKERHRRFAVACGCTWDGDGKRAWQRQKLEETRLVEWAARSTVALRDSPCRMTSESDPAPSAERPKSHSCATPAARRKEGGRSQHVGDVMNVWSSRRIVVEWTCGRRVSERCAEANRCAAVGHEARARRRENRVDDAGRVGRAVDGRPP